MALEDDLAESFPWIKQIGLSPTWLQETAATAASAAEIVAKIRGTQQYRQRFPGLTRTDGTLRMSEAEYLSTESDYRSLLRQHGFDVDKDFASPSSFVGWFDSEVAPDELSDRLTIYRQVRQGGQRLKDAFYVYAGLSVSDDELYEAVVDPAAEQNLKTKYNQAVAQQTFDYETWITRATQVGLQHVADSLRTAQSQGLVTGAAVQRILSTDANFARQVMDVIYTGGEQGGQAGSLDLQQLLDSFQFAAIGAAAEGSGLGLPTKERLAEIRAAGVDQATAIRGYSEFGRQAGRIHAAVLRARGQAFGVNQFESAEFLNDATSSRMLEQGLAQEEAAGKAGGGFMFDQDRTGRFTQSGLTAA